MRVWFRIVPRSRSVRRSSTVVVVLNLAAAAAAVHADPDASVSVVVGSAAAVGGGDSAMMGFVCHRGPLGALGGCPLPVSKFLLVADKGAASNLFKRPRL